MSGSVTTAAGVSLELRSVDVQYAGGGSVLAGFSLDVRAGELFGLIGPSGCGKSTTLGVIAGFIPQTNGSVHLGTTDVTRFSPQKRDVGVVFQNYALFPHMTAAENIGYGLRVHGKPHDYAHRVEGLLDLVRLSGKGGRLPRELSGGEQQRVAIARALAIRPKLLLLDEPLSNLDAKLRKEMQLELRRIQQETRITTIFVTHDQDEAFAVCDRIAVLNRGKIEQLGRPRELYRSPRSHFVARFIGKTSSIAGSAAAGDRLAVAGTTIRTTQSLTPGRKYICYLRPEEVKLNSGASRENTFDGTIEGILEAGPHQYIAVRTSFGRIDVLEFIHDENVPVMGQPVQISWPPEAGVFLEQGDD